MRQISRLRLFLAIAGLSYTALIIFALVVFRSTPVPAAVAVVPTLFVLPDVVVTTVPTIAAPFVIPADAPVADAPLLALAPTNTFQPETVANAPAQTLNPIQASALATAPASEPTSAPLWTSSQAEPAIISVPQGGAVPNQIVVRFQPNTTDAQKQAYLAAIGATVDQEIEPLDSVVVSVPDAARAAAAAADSDVVKTAEPDYYLSALSDVTGSNDPALIDQWALPVIQAPAAWSQLPADAPTVVVAVIDSGICAAHPDLASQIVAGWDFVDQDATPQDELGHGCSVSGVIAANVDNNLGMAGVAPNARIMPLRVLNAQGVGRYSDVAAAILYAADHGAQIINLSLGGSNASSILEDAIDYAASKGLTIVAASGNSGTPGVLYPAAYPAVIAVGSVDQNLQRSSFSSYGPEVDLMAPGRRILTTTLDGDYGYVSGTSFAAPQVAGVAALDRALGVSLPDGGGLVYAGASAAQPDPTEEATLDAAATAEATDGPIDPQFADLLEQAQQNGHVRLIVGVNSGYQPEGELSGEQQVEAQRAAIAQAQNDLISALSAYDVSITAQYEVIPYVALQADEAALRYLINSPDVTSLQEDRPVPPIAITNTSLIGADAAWDSGYRGAGQVVAVLDTGVDSGHAYLGGRVVAERCHSTSDSAYSVSSLCPNGSSSQSGSGAANPSRCSSIEACSHGTHVSGIVAGKNSSQSGVAPSASIIAVQIFSRFGRTIDCGGAAPCVMSYESDQISGLQDIYNLRNSYSIAAINMSLGGGKFTGYCDSSEVPMKSMIDSLRSVGIATVIAAGNNGYTNAMSAPGCISSAISVGATDLSDTIASWSNRASFLSLFAPGVNINSSVIGGGYAVWSGTSMATPHVAGALAVLRSYAPNASVSDLLTALMSSGATVSGSATRRIQIDAALALLGAQTGATATATPNDLIFSNGFESGSLSGWTSSATNSGHLTVSPSAALVGWYGLKATISDRNAMYVTDETPTSEKSYHARFYFDPNSITMKNGDEFTLFYGYSGKSTQALRLEMQSSSGKYQLRASIKDDGSSWKTGSWYTISDAPHAVELFWLASTSSSAKNGSVTLWIDGLEQGSVTKVDNDKRRIDMIRLGVIDGIDSGTHGTVFFDTFEARRAAYIGPTTGEAEAPAPTPVPTFTPTFTPLPPEVVFTDGFESADLSGWTSSKTDNGSLSVSPAAAMVDSYGMRAVINDKNGIYVTDDTPSFDSSYRARFYFDPNSIKMKSGDEFTLFYGYSGTSTQALRVEMQSSSGKYQLRASIKDDGSSWKTGSWYTISDAPHAIELFWLASTSSSAKDGSLTLWIDGIEQGSVTKVDNDTRRIDMIRFGAVDGIDSGTHGTVFFDAFESRRTTFIGLAAGAKLTDLALDEAGSTPTPQPTATLPAPTPAVIATATETAPTDVPATMTEGVPTVVPSTDIPPTDVPPTVVPPTDVPPTDVPPTVVPPTEIPPTSAPTEVPAVETQAPSSDSQDSAQADDGGDSGNDANSESTSEPADSPSDGG